MDLYEKIKELAASEKMSIRQLEEKLGYGNGTINRWRKATPGVDKIRKVADFFGVSVDSLLDREVKFETLEDDVADVQLGGLFRSVAKKEELDDTEQQELKEDLNWYMKERARLIKERNKRG